MAEIVLVEPLEIVVDMPKRDSLPPIGDSARSSPKEAKQFFRNSAPGSILEGDLCHICRFKGKRKASVAYCKTCEIHMCKECIDQHRSTKVTSDHQIIPKRKTFNGHSCATHKSLPVKYYCNTCSELICVKCTKADHKDHAFVEIKDKIKKSKRFLQVAVDNLDDKLLNINNEMKKMKDLEVNIEQARRKIKVKVNEQVNQLAQQLKSQHEKLTVELDDHFNNYIETIGTKKEDMKADFQTINSLRRSVGQNLIAGRDDKKVVDAMKLESDVRDAMTIDIKHVELSDFKAMDFKMANNAVLGSIEISNEPIVSNHKFVIDTSERGSVVNRLWTTMRMMYRYKTTVYLKEPSGIAVLPTGKYVVSDYSNHGLLICDKTGRFQQRVHLLDVARPSGVAVTKEGDIAVTSDRWIKTFKSKGLLGQLDQFAIYPNHGCFTIDDQGRYIITDVRSHHICIYEEDGKLVSKFEVSDKSGTPPDMFNISVRGGHIALSYQQGISHYIRLFGYDGKIIHSAKVPNEITGLFVDRSGNILVATVDGMLVVPVGGRAMQPLTMLEKNGRIFQLNPKLLGLTPEGNVLCLHQNTTANRSEIILLQPLIANHRIGGYNDVQDFQ